ncbi:hypothetical protein EMA8858_03658 [Emticicia aquatica]|uniref:Uncharacterized protein n=1 Tax=Emticicia aquatica TaxID=1681835 RepID=A0ABM9AU29_9BACT|nr:hypothetical protein EMA8858_03658 [Emticicia aquatica]
MEILGVVYVDPVPKLVPPVSAAYQVYVPEQPLALKLTVPVPQRLPPVVVGADGIAVTVAIADDLVLTQLLTVQST